MRPTTAVIDLDALRHNFKTIQSIASGSRVIAVVKADAYGHGLAKIAKALPDAEMFAVATPREAYTLRKAGIQQPILLLEGFFEEKELPRIIENDLQLVVHHSPQIDALKRLETDKKIHIWLKVDSGMNRLGFKVEELPQIEQDLMDVECIHKPIRLMSHFASADDPQDGFTSQQIETFLKSTKHLVLERSMANSAGILEAKAAHFDWVRPGLILYGCSPMVGTTGADYGLQPVMNLESKIMSIRNVNKGESTGYGRHWFAEKDTVIGLVAIGYGDGYPRHAKNGTPVWVNGRIVPLVGRVSMDMLAVELGPEHSDKIGDRVVLWGKELPAEKVAAHADTIPYTLSCGVTGRVHFVYREQKSRES
ncbi:alanine racemase [Kangiella taiwanensis]|uniref:Alanine racemase n=1 Tax=Kangiella taiwanensis TaxID=1079179 RepID=A0ABP8I3R4_9GAMM|nr:alanine racemase [Kangiella taiwanensis]